MIAMWLATTRYIPDAGLHPGVASEPIEEPIFDEPQAFASVPRAAGLLERSGLNPIEILLGIITFATALGEGAANDWLALMLVDNRGAPPAISSRSSSTARESPEESRPRDEFERSSRGRRARRTTS